MEDKIHFRAGQLTEQCCLRLVIAHLFQGSCVAQVQRRDGYRQFVTRFGVLYDLILIQNVSAPKYAISYGNSQTINCFGRRTELSLCFWWTSEVADQT